MQTNPTAATELTTSTKNKPAEEITRVRGEGVWRYQKSTRIWSKTIQFPGGFVYAECTSVDPHGSRAGRRPVDAKAWRWEVKGLRARYGFCPTGDKAKEAAELAAIGVDDNDPMAHTADCQRWWGHPLGGNYAIQDSQAAQRACPACKAGLPCA